MLKEKNEKNKLIVVLLALMLLSACNNAVPSTTAGNSYENTNPECDLSNDYWQGIGECYTLEEYNAALNSETQVAIDSFVLQGEVYFVVTSTPIPEGYMLQQNGETIYTSNNLFYAATASGEGIWVLENNYFDGKSNYSLCLISSDGNVKKTIDLTSIYTGETYERLLVVADDNLYLVSEGTELVVISSSGKLNCEIDLPDEMSYPVSGSDGRAFLVQPTPNGNQIYLVDIDSSSLTKEFLCNNGSVFSGENETFLLLENSSGLYAVMGNGSTDPIIIWEECNISIDSILSIHSIKDGQYICFCKTGPCLLSPIAPSEIKAKTTLKIAAINPSSSLHKLASAFNNSNPDYSVQIYDYSEEGAFDSDAALTRLNTEILSGSYPDMICFSNIYPYSYMSKGLLVDMTQLFERDENISIDDIAITNALDSFSGIYYISGAFNFETLVGRYSDFGDRYGWTLSEYMSIEETLPDDIETIHNMTKESFINCIVSRYIRTAVDWNERTCNFNTPEFIKLLEAGNRIRETPENLNNMSFGYGPTKVGEGTRVASLSWVETVWKLAYEERMAGCKLSFIGWPTVDGSCGSDVYLIEPVGIVSQAENVDGCWEFVKYILVQ